MAKNKTIVLSDPDNTMKTETQQPAVASSQNEASAAQPSAPATDPHDASATTVAASQSVNESPNAASNPDVEHDATVIALEDFVGTDFEEFETAEPQFETLQTLTTNQLMEM